jgi:alpha,alpha-trehalase
MAPIELRRVRPRLMPGSMGLAVMLYALAHAATAHADAPLQADAPLRADAAAMHVDADWQTPQSLFQELFTAVQDAQVFADGKSFADAQPNSAPSLILEAFRSQRPASRAALEQFVTAHFTMPRPAAAAASPPDRVPLSEHIDGLWDVLTRSSVTVPRYSSLLPLPRPYVVPGGRFREIYYWDSYFTMLGLGASGRRDLIENMVGDFANLINTYGHVPNGTRTYYLSRSQPPFFYAMVGLAAPQDPPAAFARYLPQLRREYAFWMEGEHSVRPGEAHRRVVAMPDGSVLNRYWDDSDAPRDESYREDTQLARDSGRPAAQLYRDIRAAAESGWDFGSRWFADGASRATIDTTQIVPIDLNSLLYGMEIAIRRGCERSGDVACAAEFEQRAARRRAVIDRNLWDPAGVYLDYRWTRHRRVARLSAATLYPLFVGLASAHQAAAVAAMARRRLLSPGGVVTTPVATGQQWDAPNGWAPLQWIAVSGLRDYGQSALARTIACRWLSNVDDVYRHTGKLVEKYDVMELGRSGGGGEYPTQDGFGWTNGVTRNLLTLYPAASCSGEAHSLP